ncbi:hypothetical protein [Dietzia sp.]|uniref:hypothetical protein n=1 Tax=Dietzia sp. TaxID=1871616 RepID=UPI002FD8F96D
MNALVVILAPLAIALFALVMERFEAIVVGTRGEGAKPNKATVVPGPDEKVSGADTGTGVGTGGDSAGAAGSAPGGAPEAGGSERGPDSGSKPGSAGGSDASTQDKPESN